MKHPTLTAATALVAGLLQACAQGPHVAVASASYGITTGDTAAQAAALSSACAQADADAAAAQGPKTRAQVRHELIVAEQEGLVPIDDVNYPDAFIAYAQKLQNCR